MKRALSTGDEAPAIDDSKRRRVEFSNFNEDILLEVLKRVGDARTVAAAACVSREWGRVARDERLWEAICTQNWGNIGCGEEQLRTVVLALGGFRRLHALCVWPLQKAMMISSAKETAPFCGRRWGKDEVNLSLCLLSIKCYEKMTVWN